MRRLIFFFFAGLLLSIIIYPAAALHPDRSLPDNNDTRLIAYIIGQVQNNLLSGRPLHWGSYFAPYPNTLTYSEPFITSAAISLPFRLFTSSPITIFNLAFLLNSGLTFSAGFLLFTFLTGDQARGLFASLLFFLSGFHLAYLPHLQIFSLWPAFLALYSFCRFQRQGKNRFLGLFFLFSLLQLADSLLPAYFLFLILPIFWFQKPRHFFRLLIGSLPFFLAAAVLLSPYRDLQKVFPEAVRPIRDAAHFSLGLEEIFTRYHSWTIILVLLLSFFFTARARLTAYYLILGSSLLLSFGPVVKLFGRSVKIFSLPLPLPYALLYYIFPGFNGLRTPSRFIIPALLAAVVIISLRLPKKPLLYLLIIGFLFLEAALPRTAFFVDSTPPAVYRQVAALPEDAIILELPIRLWNQSGHQIESLRSLYSLYHGKRRVGGYSGFAPLAWIDLVEQINARGLDETNLDRLSKIGVSHVLEKGSLRPLLNYYQ